MTTRAGKKTMQLVTKYIETCHVVTAWHRGYGQCGLEVDSMSGANFVLTLIPPCIRPASYHHVVHGTIGRHMFMLPRGRCTQKKILASLSMLIENTRPPDDRH